MLGRELLEQTLETSRDDRISRSHTRISIDGARVRVTDLGSRNGTFLNGHTLHEPTPVTLPSIVRTGRSVWVIVPDVRRYEHVPLQRRGRLVVAGTLDALCRELDEIANAETNVMLYGPLSIARELAVSYAATIGGDVVVFDPETMKVPLERVIGQRRLRTLIFEVTGPVPAPDIASLESWLETDIRVITLVRDLGHLNLLPSALIARLVIRRIDIPSPRFDELPSQVFDLIRSFALDAAIHATVIERCLLDAFAIDEDTMQRALHAALRRWRASGQDTLRGADLDFVEPVQHADCIYPGYNQVAARIAASRRAARVLPGGGEHDVGWALRQCAENACTGVLDPNGLCNVCGTPGSEPNSPYR